MRRRSFRSRLAAAVWASALALATLQAGPARAYDFDWIGKVELEAKALGDDDPRVRVRALSALSRYDVSLTQEHLMGALRDEDASVRYEAAQALGRHEVSAAVPILVEWLTESETRTRQVAVDTLGAIGGPRALEALVRTLGDVESTVRLRAVVALGKIGGDAVIVPLIGRLDDDKSEVRRAAIEELQNLGDRRAVIPVVGAFSDSSVEVRKAAVMAVGHLGDRAAVAALLRLLRDNVEDIKVAAITSLGHLAAVDALDRLVIELSRGTDTYRARVAYSIGQVVAAGEAGDPGRRALETLVEELANPRRRAAVREALIVAGPHATPALIAHLRGEIQGDPTTAVTLLRELGDARATPALLAEIDRGRVQLELVLDALAKVGDATALVPVLGLLSSEDIAVRMQVMLSLRPLLGSDARAADVLLDRLEDPELEIRALAIEYLGLMRSARALPALSALLTTDAPSRLRHAAVVALGEIGEPAAVGALVGLLERGPVELHAAAATALIYIGDEQALDALVPLANNPRATARLQATRAIVGIARGRLSGRAFVSLQAHSRARQDSLALTAIAGLGAGANAEAIVTLLTIVERESVERSRAAVRALGDLAAPTNAPVVTALLTALGNADDRLAGDAAWALCKLYARPGTTPPTQVLEALTAATARKGWTTALNASAALARIGASSKQELLRRLLHHREPWIRANAAVGLGAAGSKESITALVALAKSGSAVLRTAGRRALSRLAAKDALAALAEQAKTEADKNELAGLLESPWQPPARGEWRSFYVVDPGTADTPVRREPYFLVSPDGLVTGYHTDARGFIEEEWAADGDYVLAPKGHADKY